MKVKEVTMSKEYKIGLPNYSNMTVGISMTFEVKEDEKVDWDNAWDTINQQLRMQSSDIDASWIQQTELKDSYKFTVKTPKQNSNSWAKI